MVRCGVDCASTVSTSGETVCDVSSENTTLGNIVKTLEESELSGVLGVGGGDRV